LWPAGSPQEDAMDLHNLLGDDAEALLSYECKGISRDDLILPGGDFIDRVLVDTDRPAPVLRNLGLMFNTGRLAGTGHLSILPVDQGIEHSGAASFAKNPAYFDPKNLVELAIEGGCNAFATTFGVLGIVARRYSHRIPFIVKLNHNELLTYPNKYDQIMFGSPQEAYDLGAVGVGATIYFGSEESTRQIQEVNEAFQEAHALGMFTVLWCYLRNNAFKKDGIDYGLSADLTGQANHMGVTIEADIIKQKLPENNGGYMALNFGKTDPLVYSELTTDNPIDLTRWQLVNCYMGRVPLINSGGESKGEGDLGQAVRTAVINKRAGGTGLIVGRKAFQRPMKEGVELLNAVQDVYLDASITVA
jgi:fructose-bisphosphate aldolase, class I